VINILFFEFFLFQNRKGKYANDNLMIRIFNFIKPMDNKKFIKISANDSKYFLYLLIKSDIYLLISNAKKNDSHFEKIVACRKVLYLYGDF